MNRVHTFWIGTVAIMLNACGANDTAQVVSNETIKTQDSSTSASANQITVDAGDDKRAVVNEPVTISGSAKAQFSTSLSYQWKIKDEVLATSETFTYTPTTSGTYVLSFVVEDSDGVSNVDKMSLIVTNKEINTSIPAISQELIDEYLTQVNKARGVTQDCGSKGIWNAAPPVAWNTRLYKSAYEHMQDLIVSKTFSHDGSGTESDWTGFVLGIKSSQVERANTYGYVWSRLGENLGGGAPIDTAEKIVQAWLESDGHCANLMNPLFKEVGMVMLHDEDTLYVNYWAQNFGTQK